MESDQTDAKKKRSADDDDDSSSDESQDSAVSSSTIEFRTIFIIANHRCPIIRNLKYIIIKTKIL